MSQTHSSRYGESRPTDGSRRVQTDSPAETVAAVAGAVTKPLLRARDVAELLSISASTVLDWFERGALPGYKINGGPVRFDPDEIHEWLVDQHREARS